jgi:hypothetical protein
MQTRLNPSEFTLMPTQLTQLTRSLPTPTPKSRTSRLSSTRTSALTAQIVGLSQLPIAKLWALWDECFDTRPNHHQRAYLEGRIAYRLQERAYGALSPITRRKFEQIGETGKVPGMGSSIQLVPGTTLIREYNGIEHRVTVLADGRYSWQGLTFNSLSAVARAITGSAWSGPVFFNLKPSAAQRATQRATQRAAQRTTQRTVQHTTKRAEQ